MPRFVALMSLMMFALGIAGAASAQDFTGVDSCKKCHALAYRTWQKQHQPSKAQLDDPAKAPKYAAATGGNAHDKRCLECHTATRVGGPAEAVGCESCHNPGRPYLQPHARKPPRDFAGLRPLYNDAAAVAKLCIECHVLPAKDADIVAAGHPSGRDYAFADKLKKMKHWGVEQDDENEMTRPPRTYDQAGFYAKVAAAAAPLVAAKAGAPVKAAGAPAPAPAAGAVKGGGASDDEYTDLAPDEFKTPPAGGGATPVATRPTVPDRGLAKTPVPDDVPTYPEPPSAAGEAPARPALNAGASQPAASMAELRGRAAQALLKALRDKRTAGGVTPKALASFNGPDGELLQLQDEVLALALEALAGKPRAPQARDENPISNGGP